MFAVSIWAKLSSRDRYSAVMASSDELFRSMIIILLSWTSAILSWVSSSLSADFAYVSSRVALREDSITGAASSL